MASLTVVQHKQPSSAVFSSSLSDFNGARLISSLQCKRRVWQPKAALRVSASSEKKILIMGGTRFIGLFLSRLLVKEGHQVTLFTRGKAPIAQQLPGESDAEFSDFSSKILHLKGDRQDFDFVKSSLSAEGFDVVYDINGREAVEVEPILDALPNLEQYIYCSSAGVYLKTDYPPHYEVDAVDPKSRHKGKLETESLLASRDVNYTSIRPVYIYGPLNYNPVEEWFFHRLKAGRPIPVPNSGIQITQLGHVKDLATAFIKVLGNPKASKEVFNISGDKYVTFDGLARACAKAGGFPEPEIVHYNPKEFDFGKKKAFPFRDQHFFASIDKAKNLLGWTPEFDLVEGLTDSYNLDFGRGTFRKAADFSTDDIILGFQFPTLLMLVYKPLHILKKQFKLRQFLKSIKTMKSITIFNQHNFFPTFLQSFNIPSLPILQRIKPSHNHQRSRIIHALHALNAVSSAAENVHRRVVPVGPGREEHPPQRVGTLRRQHGRLREP